MNKKLLISIYVLLFLLTISFVKANVKANTNLEGTTTYLYDGTYGYTTDVETTYEIVDGAYHIINRGTAISNSGKTTNPNRLTHVFKANIKDNDNIKLVEWACKKDDNGGFYRAGLLDIALDYEKNHPGYVVLAGVNADQFYTGFGTGVTTNGTDYYSPQPYYSYISDGDNLFVNSPTANYRNIVGFKNDNSNVQFEYGARSVKGLYIHVYDKDNNLLGSFKATDLNLLNTLGNNETTILSPYKNSDNAFTSINKKSNNKFYVVNNPDLSYVSNSVEWTYKPYNTNAFFGKGTIDEVKDEVNLTNTSFAIETTNKDLQALLAKDVFVKCQYEYDDDFSNIEEGCGFHTVQILNGVAQNVANGYNTPNYPRSIFACDNEGNVYLIATERSTMPKDGMSAQEINCMMMQYGITNAFQADGGGSVQSVCRNTEGVLEYAQEPYEGAFRAVLTGTFIVMKVENISLDVTDITNNSANVVLKDNENLYKDLAISVNDGELIKLNSNDGVIKLENLTKFTEYKLGVYVLKDNGEYKEVYMSKSFTTLKDSPIIDYINISVKDNKYIFKIKMTDNDNICLKATMYFGTTKKALSFNNNECTLTIDKVDNLFDISIELDCKFTNDLRENLVLKDLNINNDSIVYLNYMSDTINSFFDFK